MKKSQKVAFVIFGVLKALRERHCFHQLEIHYPSPCTGDNSHLITKGKDKEEVVESYGGK